MPNQAIEETSILPLMDGEKATNAKIFISYSRRDKEAILRYVSLFRANGLDAWIDESGINASSEWAEQIAHAITECDVFILFLSKTSIESDNVRKEIGVAASLGKKILPLKIEDVEIPTSMLYHLNSIHFLETKRVTPEQLLEHVYKAVGKPIAKQSLVVPKKSQSGRVRFISMAAVLAIVALTAGTLLFSNKTATAAPSLNQTNTVSPGKSIASKNDTSDGKSVVSNVTRIAILYFENNSNDRPDLQPLAKGLAHMISCEAGNWQGYEVVERDALEKVLKELELSSGKHFDSGSAAQIGKLLGAEQLVFGSYMLLFDKFRIDAKVVDVETGRIIHSANAKGDPQNFDLMAQELAGRLFSNGQETQATVDKAIGLPVSVALQIGEALKKIDDGNRTEGIQLLKKLQEQHPESGLLKNTLRLAE